MPNVNLMSHLFHDLRVNLGFGKYCIADYKQYPLDLKSCSIKDHCLERKNTPRCQSPSILLCSYIELVL